MRACVCGGRNWKERLVGRWSWAAMGRWDGTRKAGAACGCRGRREAGTGMNRMDGKEQPRADTVTGRQFWIYEVERS